MFSLITDTRIAPLTLDQLDEDCLACIFHHVDTLWAQLQVARVCRRFNELIVRTWRRQSRYQTLNLTQWSEWLPHLEDQRYFLSAISDSLVAIEVCDISLNAFLKQGQALHLNANSLLAVQRFDLNDMFTDECALDADVCALSALLPKLQILRLNAPLSGSYLTNFIQLQELHLYAPREKPYEVGDVELAAICGTLKELQVLDVRNYERSSLCMEPIGQCAQLRVLKLNLNALKPVLKSVLNMPRLKQLVVLLDYVVDVSLIQNVDTHNYKIYETDEFYEILRTQGARIVGLAADLYFLPLRFDWWADLSLYEGGVKLRKFALSNCDFSAADLASGANTMKSLEVLSCRTWTELQSTHVVPVLRQCRRLRHLDVRYCKKIDKRLLYEALSIWQREGREEPLHIYYQLSGLETEIEQNSKYWKAQSNIIKLCQGFPPNSEEGLSYIQRGYEFEFE